jgi:signal transduction histidine kinase/CheY-like chemotaxis protein
MSATPQTGNDPVATRAEEIFADQQLRIWKTTDRLFAYLLLIEWLGAVIEALILSPRAWVGATSYTHINVWAALILGGIITSLPVFLAFFQPGKTLTRQAIALAQMLMSALLIHLSGGRIETHFHVFASLAFLAFYRDWRVFITASLVVAVDHALRGVLWPRSVYGTSFIEPFRWLEHTAWVVFEDIFLIVLTFQNLREMRTSAWREASNATLERMKDEAIEATNLKSRFIANVSHEFRTPLAGVMGMSELLLHSDLSEEQRQLAESVQSSARALSIIVNDLLDLSRIEANKMSLVTVVFSPASLVEECAQLFAHIAQQKNIALNINVEARVPETLCGDPTRILQVLQNLVSNALKFTERGTVSISASIDAEHDDYVSMRFSISDTGIGLSDEERQYLFLPFTQVDGSITRKYGGSGLGLAICKGLVQLMQGEIGVISKKGFGSTFWFTVPLKRVTAAAPASPTQQIQRLSPPAGGEFWVLVVEDSPTIRTLACKQVEQLGLKARGVASGQGALEELSRRQYGLVLMDCHLPDVDGFEVTRRIREAELVSGKHVPVLAVTAAAMPRDLQRCLEVGMDDYLTKPYTLAALERKISCLLNKTGTESHTGMAATDLKGRRADGH